MCVGGCGPGWARERVPGASCRPVGLGPAEAGLRRREAQARPASCMEPLWTSLVSGAWAWHQAEARL